MKKAFDIYYKNYPKITTLTFLALLFTSILAVKLQFLTFVVVFLLYTLIVITGLNIIVFNYDMLGMFKTITDRMKEIDKQIQIKIKEH